jgi:hypothetical protein
LIGGIAALVGGFVALGIVGVIAGYGLGGLLMGIYFGGLVIFYACPVGMLIGAIFTVSRAVRKGEAHLNIASILWVGVLLLVLAAVVYIPYRVIGEERTVTHAAMWIIETESEYDCATPVVILVLVEFAKYEIVCSAELLRYLEPETREVLPITYRITYDFGEPRSYQLINIGEFQLSSFSEWVGGPSGCGGGYLPPCNSPQAQNNRMLYESTWREESSNP